MWVGSFSQNILITIIIILNSWFSAPPTTRMMTHYTVEFNSAIPELAIQ